MGQKTHPVGFRLNVRKSWSSTWFAEKNNFAESLEEDVKLENILALGFLMRVFQMLKSIGHQRRFQ